MHKTKQSRSSEPAQHEAFQARQGATQMESTFVDRRESTIQLRQLASIMNASSHVTAQRQTANMIHHSPRMQGFRVQIAPLQRKGEEELESPQAKVGQHATVQRQEAEARQNNTGLPDNLKSGIESLSGMALDHVKVHYNSPRPAQLKALAYAQGSEIHIGPGQERHLPHEAWHVVQQQQGRVQPTTQLMAGVPINDDRGLEAEADAMGSKALQMTEDAAANPRRLTVSPTPSAGVPMQRKTGFEMELHVPVYSTASAARSPQIVKEDTALTGGERQQIKTFLGGGLEYGLDYGHESSDAFDITADHGAYQTTHGELIGALQTGGYINGDFLYRAMTNIEYRTPPLEERKEGATDRLKEIAAAVKAHASDTATKSKLTSVQTVNAPGLDLHTGVPTLALNKMVSGGSADVKSKVTAALTAVDPFVYFQTNTGVLPSEIPALFAKAKDDIGWNNFFSEGPKDKAAQLMLGHAVDLAKALVVETKPILEEMNKSDIVYLLGVPDGDLLSLQGWMTLVAQYLFGFQLEQSDFGTGSTSKNLVAYMSKTPIPTSLLALPARVRPFVDGTANGILWNALFSKLVAEAAKIDIVTAAGLTPSGVAPKEVIGADALTWITAILSGGAPYTVQSGRPLGLDDGQEGPNPKLKIQGEQAIVLEDRYSPLKISAADKKDMTKIDALIEAEWNAAVSRRSASTKTGEDTGAKAASAAAKHANLVLTTTKWIGVAERDFGVAGATLSGWKATLATNNPMLVFDDAEYANYNPLLAALKSTIIAHVDQIQKTRNDVRHEWLTGIIYRDIEYAWKDRDNNMPTLNTVGGVWVKLDGKWVAATDRGGYFQYQNKSAAWTKIERNLGGVKTFYSAVSTWIA